CTAYVMPFSERHSLATFLSCSSLTLSSVQGLRVERLGEGSCGTRSWYWLFFLQSVSQSRHSRDRHLRKRSPAAAQFAIDPAQAATEPVKRKFLRQSCCAQ